MRTIFRILTLVLIGTFSLLMYSGSVCAIETINLDYEGTLDQSQTESWTDVWRIGGGYRPEMAQIVTAGTYGTINKVSLYLNNVSASSPVNVSIQTVIDGKPSGKTLGQGEIPADALPSYGSPDWVDATIIGNAYSPPVVIPGTQYAVVVSSEISTTGIGTIQWYSSGNVYPQGIMLFNDGSGWLNWSVADAMFKTYVKPDELDQEYSWARTCAEQIDPGDQGGQTFTAGMSGFLTRVRVYLSRDWSSTDQIPICVASIQTVTEEGYPSGIEIGQGTFPCTAISYLYDGQVEIGIISTKPVIAGTQYAIILTTPLTIFWMMGQDYWAEVTYGGGEMMYNGGSGWMRNLPSCVVGDAHFATYVAGSRASSGLGSSSPPADDVIVGAGPGGNQTDDGGGGGCFIATAAYGSYWEPHVMTLRQFRDEYLLTNKLGTNLVNVYYKYSPPMADYIAEHDSLRAIVRIGLTPLIGFSWLAVSYGITAAFAIMFGILSLIISGTFLLVKLREST